SQGVPTANFLTAASVWNPSKASFAYIATGATNLLDAAMKNVAAIAANTQLTPTGQQAQDANGKLYYEITLNAQEGYVLGTDVRPAAVGAERVDLPVPMVFTVTNAAGTTLLPFDEKAGAGVNLPAGTRITTQRCMVPTARLPNHYEAEVADGPKF